MKIGKDGVKNKIKIFDSIADRNKSILVWVIKYDLLNTFARGHKI
jgi:hypothetical protein